MPYYVAATMKSRVHMMTFGPSNLDTGTWSRWNAIKVLK